MNTSTSLTPMSQDDTLALAIEFCRINPVFFLKLWTALIVSGLCVTGLADVGGVYFALAQRYVDAFGHFAGNPVELLAISLITLCAYFSMGILYDRNYRWAAGGLYGVVLCLLALSLWQTESPRFEEIYAGSSVQTGNVLAAPSAAADTPAPAPFLFLAFCDLVFAFAFTLAGLLFIWFKQRLNVLLERWHCYAIAREVIGQRETLADDEDNLRQHQALGDVLQNANACQRLVHEAVRRGVNRYQQVILNIRNQALASVNDVQLSAAERNHCKETLEKAEACLFALHPAAAGGLAKTSFASVLALIVMLSLALSPAARAETTTEMCASAPVFELLVDSSKSSPARDAGFIAAAIPLVLQKLRTMPPCSVVQVVTVGDASLIPLMLRSRIQVRTTKDGATMDDIARALSQFLGAFPGRIKDHEQMRSELIGGFSDAAHNLNPHARVPNVIIMLSDLVEESALANCSRAVPCRLPVPPFSLGNADVTVYGVGLGLPSHRALALEKAWDSFFNKAGVKPDLRRTF